MKPLPTELTTSDWVDHLDTISNRAEKIEALSEYHRRIEQIARTQIDPVVKEPRKKKVGR